MKAKLEKAFYILELRISDVFSMIVKVTDSSQKHSLSGQAKSYHTSVNWLYM